MIKLILSILSIIRKILSLCVLELVPLSGSKLRQVFYHFTNLYLRDSMMFKMTLARILTAILGEENANKAKC